MGLFDRKGRIYPLAAPRLQRIIALTGAKDVTVALSVRDPASFMVSAFSLQITRGHELDIRDYLCGRDVAALSWSELAERLLGVEGSRGWCSGATRITALCGRRSSRGFDARACSRDPRTAARQYGADADGL
ncbi:hypothetical protein QWZ10_17485 [Paracoccus cavernae]|uniref:Sulfotransferase domain-containing protein n=1 Tax=Paracoccus cavernae TaxID=1571207 RepID=A0ABT8DB39_9RHOB|nr:hypothetical protein [Paracoccus cavernae]